MDKLDYRPRLTGNHDIDEALRQAFDAIYALRQQVAALTTPQAPAAPSSATKPSN